MSGKRTQSFLQRMEEERPVLGDGGYLLELERRGWVDSGSGRERVGTGKGSGQFTPEVAVEHPTLFGSYTANFFMPAPKVLQALTFFGTREKLGRAGYGAQTEAINSAAVRIAREVAGDEAYVAASISRTQLFEREGSGAASHVRDIAQEQIALVTSAGVDFLIMETFFHLEEMLIALECARKTGLPIVACMTFRPSSRSAVTGTRRPNAPARWSTPARTRWGYASRTGANDRNFTRDAEAVSAPIAAQPAAFRTTDAVPCFTRLPEFPDGMEQIQLPRSSFEQFAMNGRSEGIQYVGGCCGCNAAYIRAAARGLASSNGNK